MFGPIWIDLAGAGVPTRPAPQARQRCTRFDLWCTRSTCEENVRQVRRRLGRVADRRRGLL